jgi:hypothetical protein
MKPALRSSGISWEPLGFMREEMDERKIGRGKIRMRGKIVK